MRRFFLISLPDKRTTDGSSGGYLLMEILSGNWLTFLKLSGNLFILGKNRREKCQHMNMNVKNVGTDLKNFRK